MKKFAWIFAVAAVIAAVFILNAVFGMKGTIKRTVDSAIGMHTKMVYLTPRDGTNKTYVAFAVKKPVENLDGIQEAFSKISKTLWENGIIKYGIILISHPEGFGEKVTDVSFEDVISPTREGMRQIFMYTDSIGYRMMDYDAIQEAIKEAQGLN